VENKALPVWIRIPFGYEALSPVFWVGALLLYSLTSALCFINLIPASFPYALLFVSGLLGTGLTVLFYRTVYPSIERWGEGGYLGSIQRSLLFCGSIELMLLGMLFLSNRNYPLGILFLLSAIAISLYIFGFKKEKKGFIEAFSEFVSSQRLTLAGIFQLEKLSLALILSGFIFGCLFGIDTLLPIKMPTYHVKVLNKEKRSGGRGGPSYFAFIQGWRGSKITELRVSYNLWENLQLGSPYTFKTNKGLFGGERMRFLKLDYKAMREQ
jgi:hypothetical protein